MGYLVVFGIIAAILLFALLARAGGNYHARYMCWVNHDFAMMSSSYRLCVIVIARLIEYHDDRAEKLQKPWNNPQIREIERAIMEGIDWMRRVSVSKNPELAPSGRHFLVWIQVLQPEIEQQDDSDDPPDED